MKWWHSLADKVLICIPPHIKLSPESVVLRRWRDFLEVQFLKSIILCSKASVGASVACFPLRPCCSWESSDLSGQLRNHTQPVILTSSPTLQAEVARVAPVNMIYRSHLILISLLLPAPARLCQRVFELSCDASRGAVCINKLLPRRHVR